jgi:hypothetical protein
MVPKETMLAVFLSVHAATFINWLAHGDKLNGGYFYQQILENPSQILHSE